MAKLIEYDVSGVEESGGGGTVQPKGGVYNAKIVRCVQREEKADGSPANDVMVALSLGGDYAWLYTYIGLSEAADWKMAEFVRALGLKEKGKLDPDKQVDKIISIKVNPDTYEGEYRARVGRLMKAKKGAQILPADATSDEDAPEDAADEEDMDVGDPEPEAETTDEFTATREDPEDEDVGSYDDWEDADLEEEVQDRGVTVPGGRGKKRDKWIKALRSDDEEAQDEEPEEEGEADAPEDEYDEWSADELVAEATDRELELPRKVRGSNAEERFKAKLVELLREDDSANPF